VNSVVPVDIKGASTMARQPPSPKDLDGFQPLLATTDTKRKLSIGSDLISYLGEPSNSIECVDIGLFIDGLIPWMHSSNFKVRVCLKS